ncbi:MAG: aspartate kinase [Bacillota bacterium]|nr:aspartate kinase [Bacillota bacterium]
MKVCKFGGSSLADAEQFKKVKAIVEADKERRYIVPSAPGRRDNKDFKITDILYLCYEHVQKSVNMDYIYTMLEERYSELVRDLGLSLDIDRELAEIKAQILNGASKDYCASRGEYLCSLILSEYLDMPVVSPEELIVIRSDGKLDDKLSYEKIGEVLSKYEKAVIPGFYGATKMGKIKTFSRGGSDISGAVIARGLHADLYENWTDVSGFMMADPRIVGKEKGILELTFKELRELSYMGANVFHEEAVFPVYGSGISINIKNTNRPEDPGTMIVDKRDIHKYGPVTGISAKKNFTVIAIEKSLLHENKNFYTDLINVLNKHNVNFEHIPSSIDSLSVVISDEEIADKLDQVMEDLEQKLEPDSIQALPNMALVAVVGAGMVKTKGMAAKIFTAFSDSGVNIRMINQGSNELSIIIGVENDDVERAINGLFSIFAQ